MKISKLLQMTLVSLLLCLDTTIGIAGDNISDIKQSLSPIDDAHSGDVKSAWDDQYLGIAEKRKEVNDYVVSLVIPLWYMGADHMDKVCEEQMINTDTCDNLLISMGNYNTLLNGNDMYTGDMVSDTSIMVPTPMFDTKEGCISELTKVVDNPSMMDMFSCIYSEEDGRWLIYYKQVPETQAMIKVGVL